MKIKIDLRSQYKNVIPVCKIYSRYSEYTIEIPNNLKFEQDFDIKMKDFLHIEFVNKDGNDDNVIFIDSIEIDGINLQHYIYEGTFYPEYDADWLSEQSTRPPTTFKPCTELRLKGVWKFSIITPIWKMIMEKWLNDSR